MATRGIELTPRKVACRGDPLVIDVRGLPPVVVHAAGPPRNTRRGGRLRVRVPVTEASAAVLLRLQDLCVAQLRDDWSRWFAADEPPDYLEDVTVDTVSLSSSRGKVASLYADAEWPDWARSASALLERVLVAEAGVEFEWRLVAEPRAAAGGGGAAAADAGGRPPRPVAAMRVLRRRMRELEREMQAACPSSGSE